MRQRRDGRPVDETEFPIFRVGYGDHSSWDMVWLRIDYNGHGFDAFVTDINLNRTRISDIASTLGRELGGRLVLVLAVGEQDRVPEGGRVGLEDLVREPQPLADRRPAVGPQPAHGPFGLRARARVRDRH